MNNVTITNWKYAEPNEWCDTPAGWRCIIYDRECGINIDEWLERTMTGLYECDFRFNGGVPFYSIYIKEQRDAEFFLLTFQ